MDFRHFWKFGEDWYYSNLTMSFKFFSQLQDENNEPFYPSYDLEALLDKWNEMQAFKVKKVDKNKSWDKIKKWAKKDNEEIFNQIFKKFRRSMH